MNDEMMQQHLNALLKGSSILYAVQIAFLEDCSTSSEVGLLLSPNFD